MEESAETEHPPETEGWIARFRNLLEGESPIALRNFLLLAFLIRLPAVLFSRGYEFMDHQFQSVDPAYHLAFGGSWWKTWEFHEGMRSWLYPGVLAGMFKAIHAIGITHPSAMLTVTRLLHSVLSLLPMFALWMLVVRWKKIARPNPVLLLMATSGLMIFSGVQPNGTAVAVGLSLTAIFLFHGPGFWWPLCAGISLGFAFACRFQDAFFGPVLFLGGLWLKRYRESMGLAVGAAVTVVVQGLVDYYTYGEFLSSPFRYVDLNVFQDTAAKFGQKPFWYYFKFLALLTICIPPFLRSVKNAVKFGAWEFPLPFACATAYLLLHSVVARKAVRFVFPVFLLLLFVIAVGLFRSESVQRKDHIHRRLVVGLQVIFALILSFAYFHKGPIEAALWLRAQPDFMEHLIVTNGEPGDVGGHMYLDRARLDVYAMPNEKLAEFFRTFDAASTVYVISVVKPLPTDVQDAVVREAWKLELKQSFQPWPNLKKKRRRFIYKVAR
jgi:hypothetical protein